MIGIHSFVLTNASLVILSFLLKGKKNEMVASFIDFVLLKVKIQTSCRIYFREKPFMCRKSFDLQLTSMVFQGSGVRSRVQIALKLL